MCHPHNYLPHRTRPFTFRSTTAMADQTSQHIGFTKRRTEAQLKKSGLSPVLHPPNKLTFDIPSLPYNWLDLHGQRQLVPNLVRYLDFATLFWPLPAKDPDEKLTLYLLNYDMSLSPALYDDSKKFPLVLDSMINYVKRTSRCYQLELRQREQTVPMVTTRYIEINVDSDTRKPVPYPQWWKDQHQFPEDGSKPEVGEVTKPEVGVLTTERKIRFTDIDENNHTNFSVYIRFSLDAFYENVVNVKYTNNSPLLLNGWVKTMKIRFQNESVLGDSLTVDTWEDPDNLATYHFEIRKGQAIAVTISLSFLTSLIKSQV